MGLWTWWIRRRSARTFKRKLKERQKPGFADRQSCSICHRKAARLYFYADEIGKPLGVCKACKPQAEKRDLLPL